MSARKGHGQEQEQDWNSKYFVTYGVNFNTKHFKQGQEQDAKRERKKWSTQCDLNNDLNLYVVYFFFSNRI